VSFAGALPKSKAALPFLTLLLVGWTLVRPAPTVVDLGAGDEALARGFQDWERAGPEGHTMFRWSRDGARIELPASVKAETLRLRLRVARFLPQPVELVWHVNGHEAARQTVAPRGWHVETLDLGPTEGPLVIDVRSPGDPEGLGAAIDWVEVQGARRLVPRPRELLGLFGLIFGLPVAAHLIAGTRATHAVAATVLLALPAMLYLDPGRGLVAAARAAPAALFVFAVFALFSRFRPGEFHPAFTVAAVAATLALLLLLHPAFYYPDVDTHSRLLWSIRQDPHLIVDPSPYQQRTGAWTRGIGGEKVAFPYSAVFHAVAWPLAWLFGDTDAIKVLAVIAFGGSILLVHALARTLGLAIPGAVLAQALFASMPVQSSRLFLALFPTLFGQALELTVLLALARHLGSLGVRSSLIVGALMLVTQAAYTGSLVNVAMVAGALAVILLAVGEGRAAGRVTLLGAVSTAIVGAVLYARFLPVFWTKVLAPSGADLPEPEGSWGAAIRRIPHFFGVVYPLLAAGTLARRPRDGRPAMRVLAAAAAAGVTLVVLRGAAPFAVRDVKEVELLAGPVAILAAWALHSALEIPRVRPLAVATAVALVAWGLVRCAQAYAAGLFVLGR
jgi:hypothetical protein